MILRLSTKLATKIKVATKVCVPPGPNPYEDWSAHLFTADRAQYILITNTASLYSVITYGRNIRDDDQFLEAVFRALGEYMIADGTEFMYRKFVGPSGKVVRFSKALNRSVTGSMNDLVYHATMWLTEGELSPFDTSFKLNEIPFSALSYQNPREVFKGQVVREEASDENGGKVE